MKANNPLNVSDLANWINFQLSTIIEGVSAGYTLGNNNSVWIDRGATMFTVSLATSEEIEVNSDDYNTAEEIAKAIISILNKNTPSTSAPMNSETKTMNEATKSVNDIMNQACRLQAECNAKRNFKRSDAIREIAFRYFDNIRACAGSFNSNDDAEYNKQYLRARYMNGVKAVTVTIISDGSNLYTATVNGVAVGSVNTWFNNTFAASYNFGISTRKRLAMPELDNAHDAAHGFTTEANAVLWLGDMITRYFAGHGITANIVNA